MPSNTEIVADAVRQLEQRVARLDARQRETADATGRHDLARRAQAGVGPVVVLVIGLFAPFVEASASGPDTTDHFSVIGLLWAILQAESRTVSQAGTVVVVSLLLAVVAAVVAGWAVSSACREPSRRARIVCGWSAAVGIVALIVARVALPGDDADVDISLQFGFVALVCGYLWSAAVVDAERGREDYR